MEYDYSNILIYDEADIIIYDIKEKLEKYFGNRVTDIYSFGKYTEPFIQLHISFVLYNYCNLLINIERSRFGCSINDYNKVGFSVENSQKGIGYDNADLDIFVREIDEQVRIRIPDKYLIAKGWGSNE